MKRTQWMVAIMAAGVALFLATPRSEADNFIFSISSPVLCQTRPPACPKPAPQPGRVWVPGHFETRTDKVWVEGTCQQIWVPPTFGYVWTTFHYVRVERSPGHYETIKTPGHYEFRETRVWVPGHYETTSNCEGRESISRADRKSAAYF